MKKLNLKLICTAALLAALPLAGCSSAEGKQTTQDDEVITQQQIEETCPDGDCDDCPECPNEDKKDCPDCEDGKDGKDECPKCPKRKRGRTQFPRGSFREHKNPHLPPKKPVKPPKDDDIILPDPPVEGELPQD